MSKIVNPKPHYARFTKQVITQPLIENGVQKRDKDGQYLAIRETKTLGYDSVLRKWVVVDVQKDTLTPEQLGMTQHAKLKVVFQRSAKNDLLETVYRFFVVECSVDFKDSNRHEWITVSNGSFWYHNLQHGKVAMLSFSSKFVKKTEPKPISEKAVLTLLKSKEIAYVYNENLREVCLFHRSVQEA